MKYGVCKWKGVYIDLKSITCLSVSTSNYPIVQVWTPELAG